MPHRGDTTPVPVPGSSIGAAILLPRSKWDDGDRRGVDSPGGDWKGEEVVERGAPIYRVASHDRERGKCESRLGITLVVPDGGRVRFLGQ